MEAKGLDLMDTHTHTHTHTQIRRLARPHFQSSLPLKWTYDIVTIVVTAIFLGFAGITFHLLWLKECLLFWT